MSQRIPLGRNLPELNESSTLDPSAWPVEEGGMSLQLQIALSRARSERLARQSFHGVGASSVPSLQAMGSSTLASLGGGAPGTTAAGLPTQTFQLPLSLQDHHPAALASHPLTSLELRMLQQRQTLLPTTPLYAQSRLSSTISALSAPSSLIQQAQLQQHPNLSNLNDAELLELALRRSGTTATAGSLAGIGLTFPSRAEALGLSATATVGLPAVNATTPSLYAQELALLRARQAWDGPMDASVRMNLLAANREGAISAANQPLLQVGAVSAAGSSSVATPRSAKRQNVSASPPCKKKRKYDHESFPEKLHRLICEAKDAGKGHIVNFSNDGNVFTVTDTSLFEKEILPHYFRHNNINSFKRLLRMYGFKKISGTWMQGSFQHPFFMRDRPDLCKHMERVGSSGGGLDAKDNDE